MINEGLIVPSEESLNVLEGINLSGGVNTTDEQLTANILSSIRRGHRQISQRPVNKERIALVGSGPSLLDTKDELFELLQRRANLVTVNGSYKWCLDQGFIPNSQIVMDARPENARFLDPYVENCHYLIASQCAPEVWDKVQGRKNVWIFHAYSGLEGPLKGILDQFYLGNWFGVSGGSTVVTRALTLLRMLGYLRFDLFGVDSCFMHGEHHAFEQAENSKDKPLRFTAAPSDRPDLEREFFCAPWHVKQLECMLQMIRLNGNQFVVTPHGDGLLAFALKANADVSIVVAP